MKFKDVYGDLSGTVYEGDLDCSHNKLTSLEGCPKEVHGDFYCSDNDLTSLEHGPKEVHGSFYCSYNKLTSLKGCLEIVKGKFSCSGNKLTSLEYGPKEIQGDFYCSDNDLTSLDSLLGTKIKGKLISDFSKEEVKQFKENNKLYLKVGPKKYKRYKTLLKEI